MPTTIRFISVILRKIFETDIRILSVNEVSALQANNLTRSLALLVFTAAATLAALLTESNSHCHKFTTIISARWNSIAATHAPMM